MDKCHEIGQRTTNCQLHASWVARFHESEVLNPSSVLKVFPSSLDHAFIYVVHKIASLSCNADAKEFPFVLKEPTLPLLDLH
jgi:hypothetical protein